MEYLDNTCYISFVIFEKILYICNINNDAMPKQVQFTKEIIINAAIEILRSDGIEALTARSLSKKLGCSVAPIFNKYANMEELMADVRKASGKIVSDYLADAVNYEPAFKEFGLRLVRFSKAEPNLFHYLFLDKNGSTEYADAIAKECLVQTKSEFELSDEHTTFIYAQIWPFVCGLAQLCNRNPEIYNDECVSRMLSTQFQALKMLVKSGCEVENIQPVLKVLETDRLILRPWRDTDADALFKYASDPEVGPHAGWPPHKSVEESLEVIRNVFSAEGMWAMELKETGEAIGCVGYLPASCSNLDITEDQCEVGYWIGRPYWNNGYCTEALRAVVDYCYRVKGFTVLWGDYFPENPASGRVMEKCGFADTGCQVLCSSLEVGSDRPVRVMRLQLGS